MATDAKGFQDSLNIGQGVCDGVVHVLRYPVVKQRVCFADAMMLAPHAASAVGGQVPGKQP